MLHPTGSPSIAPTEAESAATQPNLLVIDDDIVHRSVIARVASRAGFHTTGAATVDEAAQQFQSNAFDGITLDLSLGKDAGVRVLHILGAMRSKTPVVIISGADDAVLRDTMQIALAHGLDVRRVVSKPIDLASLRDILISLNAGAALGTPA